MLDMGFKQDVDAILEFMKDECETFPQVLLFSATVPDWVRQISRSYLKPNSKTIDLAKNLKDKT